MVWCEALLKRVQICDGFWVMSVSKLCGLGEKDGGIEYPFTSHLC